MLGTIFEIIITILFIGLFIAALRLTFKITWGITKIIAILLFVIAIPALIGCLLFAGGAVFLLPLGLIVLAIVLVKRCAE